MTPASHLGHGVATSQAVALAQEDNSKADASDQADDARDSLPIASTQAQIGAPRAVQEDQGAEHGKHTEEKALQQC
jgi:hypothetical protein